MLSTMHAKEAAFDSAAKSLGAQLIVPHGIDTDAFGTFTGEIKRQGDMREAAIAKARAGMRKAGCSIGIASEGSFAPLPAAPFLSQNLELAVLVDDEREIVVVESAASLETNFSAIEFSDNHLPEEWLTRVGFPEHGLIVRSIGSDGEPVIVKGIRSARELRQAIEKARNAAPSGVISLETDMRAHMNPTRMRVIAEAANRLAARLNTLCPGCGSPGWGQVYQVGGLPCADCGLPTTWIKHVIYGCPACPQQSHEDRGDGLVAADSQHCAVCNP